MSIRIMLVDGHAILLDGLSKALQQEEDLKVVGQAKDGHSTVELVRELLPDVVVMEIEMPELNGMEATRQIAKECPQVKVIGLSMHSSNKYVKEMFRAGAMGYLLMDCPFEELVQAIRTVHDGKIYLSPSISHTVIEDYISEKDDESAFSVLSQREREVLQLIAEGYSTKKVGLRLNISAKTVEVHRSRIMSKLELNNIAQLTKYAVLEGLTTPEP